MKQQDLVRTVEVLHSEFLGQAECEIAPAAQDVWSEPKIKRVYGRLLPFAIQPVFNS